MSEKNNPASNSEQPAVVAQTISTHLNQKGEAHMVDVGAKHVTQRKAVARARVNMSAATLERLLRADTPKGDVLATARIAAIMAAKKTAEMIPLCHSIALTHVQVDITTDERGVILEVLANTADRTGVEMEALFAASTGALTVYDMLKGIERGMTIEVGLLEKDGGRTGHWVAETKIGENP